MRRFPRCEATSWNFTVGIWWPHGIYTESILTTLIITRKFGRGYPIFDSSHQYYGITAWYRLLMYCVYNDNHWSLVNIFLGSGSWIILRVDPSSPELDKDTRLILEHLKWTQTKGPNGREASRGQEDILIDITVPAGRDTQTCGLRVLQYHAIIGNAFATRPEILREGEETLQTYIKETVFPQIQQVNIETTEPTTARCAHTCNKLSGWPCYARIQHGRIYCSCRASANFP